MKSVNKSKWIRKVFCLIGLQTTPPLPNRIESKCSDWAIGNNLISVESFLSHHHRQVVVVAPVLVAVVCHSSVRSFEWIKSSPFHDLWMGKVEYLKQREGIRCLIWSGTAIGNAIRSSHCRIAAAAIFMILLLSRWYRKIYLQYTFCLCKSIGFSICNSQLQQLISTLIFLGYFGTGRECGGSFLSYGRWGDVIGLIIFTAIGQKGHDGNRKFSFGEDDN